MDWMDKEANEWNDEMIEEFIWFQNNYSYDGAPPVRHTAQALIRFSDMDAPEKISRFNEIYNRMYAPQ